MAAAAAKKTASYGSYRAAEHSNDGCENDYEYLQPGEEMTSSSSMQTDASPLLPSRRSWWAPAALGPGLFVCLADTDAGCLIVAAQSGARWGYSLLLLQVVLIPILYMAQELTVRLGVHTKMGHTACIKRHFGTGWAWFACVLLVFECVFAMMSELSGVAAVGEVWGFSRMGATFCAAVLIICVVFFCNYRQIEAIGTVLGMFELTFVVTMFCFHPAPREVFLGTFTYYSDPEYIKLIAANIGAVLMPWMIYFQQSAVVARRLETREDIRQERAHTLLGSMLTQLVMIGTLVTLAAAHNKAKDLHTVKDIIDSLGSVLGWEVARVLVSMAFVGGSLCAAFVVSLAATWALCEALGVDDQYSLDKPPASAPWFYTTFLAVLLLGILVLISGVSIVKLNVLVELMDGLLLPFTVGFLYLLATGEALPPDVRVGGAHKYVLAVVFSLCTALSLSTAFYGLLLGD